MRQVCQCLDGKGEVDVQAAAMIVFADDDRISSTWGRWHP